MTKVQMLANLNSWFDKVLKLFKSTSGETHQMLYVDNPTGLFSFTKETAVTGMNIATTASELAGAKASIEADPTKHGIYIANQMTTSMEIWNTSTSTWEVDKKLYPNVIRQSRYYYSPWNQTLWLTTTYGALKRFMTTGLTKIG